MTPAELAEAGRALFGERWQADMTDALGLRDSSRIRQFLSGRRSIPIGIRAQIVTMLMVRGERAMCLARRLNIDG